MWKDLKKPTPQITTQSKLDWSDVRDYIEQKYNIKLRGYAENNEESHFDMYQISQNDPMPFGNGIYPDVISNIK